MKAQTLDKLETLLRIVEGWADVLHLERGHAIRVLWDDCTCRQDAELAVSLMVAKKAGN